MNKVLVNIYVPILNVAYDVFVPVQLQLFEVIGLVKKAIADLSEGRFIPSEETTLAFRSNGSILNVNRTVYELNIGNGTKLLLI